MNEQEVKQITEARGKFAAMVATYGLGVFNDSFFRQSAILLAMTVGLKGMEGWIMAIFTLPYLLFASAAGWMADRFPKRHVVIGAKLLELVAMLCGAVGICTMSWELILTMAFMMGLQSCLFSPALNGSIPELYPDSYVNKANATLKVVVTAMILAGVANSGLALDWRAGEAWCGVPMGQLLVAVGVVAISLLGVLISFGVPHRPAANPRAEFPWDGPVETFKQLGEIRKDRLLMLVVTADMFVWFAGAMLILLISVLAKGQFVECGVLLKKQSNTMAGYLVAAQVVGVAVGGVMGSRLAVGRRWFRVLPLGAIGMGAALLGMMAIPMLPVGSRLAGAFALLGITGVMGGLFMVPCEAFVQIRPAADRKGRVIASVNFMIFFGILLSGPLEVGLIRLLRPTDCLGVLGGFSVLVGVGLWWALRKGGSHD
ncbi:MAG: MFS transporter [Phycisphaerae bacterium]|nr:MFS transporter [Phycisphaerae bacterium]